jgi:hypothetical protein
MLTAHPALVQIGMLVNEVLSTSGLLRDRAPISLTSELAVTSALSRTSIAEFHASVFQLKFRMKIRYH